MTVLPVLICMIFVVSHPLIIGTHANRDGDVLYAFRQAVTDHNDILTNWDNTLVDPSTWWRVVCNTDASVTKINLGRTGLSGKLVGDLGKLTKLEHLLLNNNNLSGAIPDELGDLTSLLDLDLNNNFHSGSIPGSLGKLTALRYLRLNDNKLNGPIPDTLTSLNELLVLNLSNNQLSGEIPQKLYHLKNLRYLDLTKNNGLPKDAPCVDKPCYYQNFG